MSETRENLKTTKDLKKRWEDIIRYNTKLAEEEKKKFTGMMFEKIRDPDEYPDCVRTDVRSYKLITDQLDSIARRLDGMVYREIRLNEVSPDENVDVIRADLFVKIDGIKNQIRKLVEEHANIAIKL